MRATAASVGLAVIPHAIWVRLTVCHSCLQVTSRVVASRSPPELLKRGVGYGQLEGIPGPKGDPAGRPLPSLHRTFELVTALELLSPPRSRWPPYYR
jgi:hypothetical protein